MESIHRDCFLPFKNQDFYCIWVCFKITLYIRSQQTHHTVPGTVCIQNSSAKNTKKYLKNKQFATIILYFHSFCLTLQEFAGFLQIEAVWGFEDFLGYGLETVLNSTFCYKLLNALGFAASLVEEHPKMGHQPFYDSSSGAKVMISFESSKCFANYSLAFFISRLVALSSFCSSSIRSFSCSWVGSISLIRILL